MAIVILAGGRQNSSSLRVGMHNKYLFLSEKAVEQIRSAKDKDELGNAISRALGDLGFQSFHFSCFKKDKDELVYDPTCCAWAGDFFEAYRREDWNAANPLLRRSILECNTFAWSAVDNPTDTDYQRYMGFLRDGGIQSGVIVHVATGNTMSGISAEMATAQSFSLDIVKAVSIVTQAAMMRAELLGLGKASAIEESIAGRLLTATQLEILKWAAEGKSNSDIATIMGMSKRGIDYHMGEILRKLGVATRIQAISTYFGQR